MEEKVKIVIPEDEIKEVEFLETKVKVQSAITLEQADIILEDIKSVVFSNKDLNNKSYFIKLRAIKDILDLCTNIDISEITSEQLKSPLIEEFLYTNIENLYDIIGGIQKEYEMQHMEECFGILAKKVPTAKQMEKSMSSIKESINGLDSDKLELVAKSIVWNQNPTLGKVLAPAEHIEE